MIYDLRFTISKLWTNGSGSELKPFSLTLTLSRWEREQPVTAFRKFAGIEQYPAIDSPRSRLRFSLSQRERAGVRESALLLLSDLSILPRRINLLPETHRLEACATTFLT